MSRTFEKVDWSDQVTFLGDFEDVHTVKLLDGSMFQARVNMYNEDKICETISKAAEEVGITLRAHRLYIVKDEDDPYTILALQSPPPSFDFTHPLNLNDKTSLDLVDYLSTIEEVQCVQELTLEIIPKMEKCTTNIYKLLAEKIHPQILDLANVNEPLCLQAFSGQDIRQLNVKTLDDQIVDAICRHLPTLQTLVVGWLQERDFSKTNWGYLLATQTKIDSLTIKIWYTQSRSGTEMDRLGTRTRYWKSYQLETNGDKNHH